MESIKGPQYRLWSRINVYRNREGIERLDQVLRHHFVTHIHLMLDIQKSFSYYTNKVRERERKKKHFRKHVLRQETCKE